MLRLLPFGAIIMVVFVCLPARAATHEAASCSYTDVNNLIQGASVVNGDTVTIPAGTCIWSTRLTFSKSITLQGAGCTLDGDGRPTSCLTVIQDAMASGSLIDWTLASGVNARMTGIEFENNGRGVSGTSGIIIFSGSSGGSSPGAQRIRVDHCLFDHLNGVSIRSNRAWGVIDHSTFLSMNNSIPIYVFTPTDYAWADARWNAVTSWGGETFLFIEDNTFTVDVGSHYAVIDAYAGARFVFRFNDVTRGWIEAHGTESGGRARGTRALEAYYNNMTASNGGSIMVNVRSGAALIHNNTATGYTANPAMQTVNERAIGFFTPWGIADGTNSWDDNDASNPIASHTASSGGTLTVTVSGAGWTPNQYRGYMIRKTNSCTPSSSSPCASPIISNTSDTITFSAEFNGDNLSFSASDTFDLNLIDAVMDAPGRSGGSNLNGVASPSVPVGWNNQSTDPIYAFLNLEDSAEVAVGPTAAYSLQIRANEHYYNYTASFSGATGIGSGTRASRPASTTNGVAYWATDQGGDWNTSSGGANDGCLDIVAAGAWVNCSYTPYTYPHPLADGVSVSSISPAFGQQGAAVAVTLTGLGFEGGNATINAISGITISGTTVVSDTSITATFTIAGGATLGDRNVTVTTDEGTSNVVTFEVLASGAVPTITAISPSSEDRGATASVTLTGTNFTGGTVSLSGTGVTTDNCKVVSATSITCDFIVAASTGWGLREVTVTNGSGASNTVNFTVSAPGIGPGRMWMR